MFKLNIFGLLILIVTFTNCMIDGHDMMGITINIQQSKFDRAYEYASEFVLKYPANIEGWYYYGALSGLKGNYEVMETAFSKATKLDGNPKVYLPFDMDENEVNLRNAIKINNDHFININIQEAQRLLNSVKIEDTLDLNTKYLELAKSKIENAELIDPNNPQINFMKKIISDYEKLLK